jgi:arsenate reductase
MLSVYLNPTCSTCRALVDLLESRGIEFEGIDYYVHRLDEAHVRALVAKSGGRARDFLRTRERPDLAEADLSEEDVIGLIASDPDLVQRPIVEVGDRAVVARPPERALDLLAAASS